MSYIEHVAATAGFPVLASALGTLEADGKLREVMLSPPTAHPDAEPIKWGCIVGRLELVESEDLAGTHLRKEYRESTTLHGPSPSPSILMGTSVSIPDYPGELFEVETINRSGATTILTVYRIADVEAIQRHGFER